MTNRHTSSSDEDNQPLSERTFIGIIGISLIGTGIFFQLLALTPGIRFVPATAPQIISPAFWVFGLACFVVSILNPESITKSYLIEKVTELAVKYIHR